MLKNSYETVNLLQSLESATTRARPANSSLPKGSVRLTSTTTIADDRVIYVVRTHFRSSRSYTRNIPRSILAG